MGMFGKHGHDPESVPGYALGVIGLPAQTGWRKKHPLANRTEPLQTWPCERVSPRE